LNYMKDDAMHCIREIRQKRNNEKDFQVFSAHSLKHRFREEIEILECEDEREKILAHPRCPFREFAFWGGKCEIDMTWYYIAANGTIFSPITQVILPGKKENLVAVLDSFGYVLIPFSVQILVVHQFEFFLAVARCPNCPMNPIF